MDFINHVDKKTMAGFIDHTNLKPDATAGDIIRLCAEAVRYRFAAVCLNPVYTSLAAGELRGTGVRICTVAGFPLGAGATSTKVAEAVNAVCQGAGEIDMVIALGPLKDGRLDYVKNDIEEVVRCVRQADPEAIVKVIIETCFLSDPEKIAACRISEDAGAGFVKTSTGFGPGGAVLSDVQLMKKSVGPGVLVKASGGIRSASQAVEFIRVGADRIGTSSGPLIMEAFD